MGSKAIVAKAKTPNFIGAPNFIGGREKVLTWGDKPRSRECPWEQLLRAIFPLRLADMAIIPKVKKFIDLLV